jgi:1-acyl-sn-glycerol-3-phosphate acyltransferase
VRAVKALDRLPRGPWASFWPVFLAPWPTVFLLPFAIGGRALLLACGLRTTAERYSARVQRLWARSTLRAFGVRVHAPAPPREAALIAANHLSWLDILVLGGLQNCRFVAKAEISRWPVFGTVARSVGTVFIDRSARQDTRRVAEEMERLLAAGISVVLFPEAGVGDGTAVRRFHPALFAPAARAGMPCRPVALTYRTPDSPFGSSYAIGWWGGVGLAWHAARLRRFGRVEAHCRWAEAALRGDDRKLLAEAARDQVARDFEPLGAGPIPPGDPRRAGLPGPAASAEAEGEETGEPRTEGRVPPAGEARREEPRVEPQAASRP